MKRRYGAATAIIIALSLTWYFHTPTPTVLSLHIGSPYVDVVRDSTFPVASVSLDPATDSDGFGITDVTKPAVILHFDDQQHGFTLPPTTFAAITYAREKVITIATSPMLKKLPFDEAVDLLAQLQAQFKAGGWQPWPENGSIWFDLTPAGRSRLHRDMLITERSSAGEQWLSVPGKYLMTFRIKCAEDCERMGPDRYLIDIGVGQDFPELYLDHQKDPVP